jgi:ABC-2 type transport system permease protein
MMENIRKTFAIASKELQLIVKDRGFLFLIFLLPLLISTLVAAANAGSGESLELPVGILNRDDGRYSADILDIMNDIEEIQLTTLESVEQANQLVSDSELLAAVLIPENFTRDVDAYTPTSVEVIVDPTQARYSTIITTVMEEVVEGVALQGEVKYGMRTVMGESGALDSDNPNEVAAAEAQQGSVFENKVQDIKNNPLIEIKREDMEGAEVFIPDNLMLFFTPGFTVMFGFFLVPTLAAALLKEREEGSLRRLMAAPMPRAVIIAGKILAFMLLVVLQVAAVFGVAGIAFDMPLGSSPLGLLAVTAALGLAATSLGLMIAALVRSENQASSVGMLLVFVLAGVGGALQLGPIPVFLQDNFLGTLSKFTPHAHALIGYRHVMLLGGGFVDVLPQVGILIAMSAVFFVISVWRFRFE